MELANQLILLAAGLLLVSIFLGAFSARFGAPLLLVFLGLGMLAGEDGIGGILYDDYEATYLIGSVALAVILFDGGLRTSWKSLKSVSAPATVLATIGVLVTAGLTSLAAGPLLGLDWRESILVGAIVGSTDAAAVFLLLQLRGLRVQERTGATLEAEAGLNDPMAILLTTTAVQFLTIPDAVLDSTTLLEVTRLFATQMLGGLIFGVIGGTVLLFLVNRMTIASGLYPVMTMSGALLLFALSQEVDASGFLATYIAGLIIGNNRHKATALIERFHDGLIWLCQIVMFLILGLLVTPSDLAPVLAPGLLIALVLILFARPVAVFLCLAPFRYRRREMTFISWVGLRGAVPIFLGTIPVLAGIPNAETYFGIAYIIVLTSMVVQGWTIGIAGRKLDILLPPRAAKAMRTDLVLPSMSDRNMAAYKVQPNSLALRRPLARLPLPQAVEIAGIMRDGTMHVPGGIEQLAVEDDVLVMADPDQFPLLDRIFGAKPSSQARSEVDAIGLFSFPATVTMTDLADLYGVKFPQGANHLTIGEFLRKNAFTRIKTGHRLRINSVDFIVTKVVDGEIDRVHIDLEPKFLERHLLDPLLIRLNHHILIPVRESLARWMTPGR